MDVTDPPEALRKSHTLMCLTLYRYKEGDGPFLEDLTVWIDKTDKEWKGKKGVLYRGSYDILYRDLFWPQYHSIFSLIDCKCVYDTKLERVASSLEGRIRIQNAHDSLDKEPEGNKVQFNKDKCKALHLRRNNPFYKCKSGNNILASCSAEKDLAQWITKWPILDLQQSTTLEYINSHEVMRIHTPGKTWRFCLSWMANAIANLTAAMCNGQVILHCP